MKNPLDYVELNHLTGEQLQLARIIGIEAYRDLCNTYGGSNIYVAKPDIIISKCRANIIKERADGLNSEELCRIFHISIRDYDKIVQGFKL